MSAVAPTNVTTAYVILVVLLALFSPAADPARLSVNNQVARLQAGVTAAHQFDFEYLKFQGARYGLAALDQLRNQAQGADAEVIRQRAQHAFALKHPGQSREVDASNTEIAANISVWPKDERLPDSFTGQDWSRYERRWELPYCLRQARKPCDAVLIDLSGEGKKEIFLLPPEKSTPGVVMTEKPDGTWSILGRLPVELSACTSLRQRMIAGEYRLITPRMKDLEIGGLHVEIEREQAPGDVKCPPMPN